MSVMFVVSGDPHQRSLVHSGVKRCDFPFERLRPQLLSESDRETILIQWADLATEPRFGTVREHKIKPDVEHRGRVLGEAWTDGVVRIDHHCAEDPELAHEVLLSELGHQVDFHYLDEMQRRAIFDAYHEPGASEHDHGWFDVGTYEEWVGESFMGGFTRAYSDVAVTLTQFVHRTTDEAAVRIRQIITPELGAPPWSPQPTPETPETPPPPVEEVPPPREPEKSSWWQRLSDWLLSLLNRDGRSDDMAGIEQTSDVIRAAGAVGLFLKQAAVDGWSFDDLRNALNNKTLRNKVLAAVRDSNKIPGEISDIDLQEVVELVVAVGDEFGEAV